MSILITGATGTIGTQLLTQLHTTGFDIRALTRTPATARLPTGVTPVGGDLAEPDSLRAALDGVDTLFLLVANVADELTQTLQALHLAQAARLKGIVYFSVQKSDEFADVPHFAAKATAERMIDSLDLPATILRPAYFIQNDRRLQQSLLQFGVYGMPVGTRGVSMVDIRDIAEAATIELRRRHLSAAPLPRELYTLVGPDALTGPAIARLWSDALGRAIAYGGDDLAAMEQRLKATMPGWHALDLRLMLNRYQTDGAIATEAELTRLTTLLGHPPRSYRSMATDAARQWTQP